MTLNFLIDKQTYSRRLAYVVRIIARRLGYPYSLINDPAKISPLAITITYLPENDLEKYSDFPSITIFNTGEIHHLEKAEKTIDLFEWAGNSLPVIGGKISTHALQTWKISTDNSFRHKKMNGKRLIPLDLFLNVFYHFSRFEEKWRHFSDETQTDYSSSILSRYDDLKSPVVDILINYLDDLIRNIIFEMKLSAVRVTNWPGGEEMGVALTHDVDITREIHFPERFLKNTEYIISRLWRRKGDWRESISDMEEKDARAWNFPELIQFYKEKQWHATFFFLAKWLEGRHFRYNIRSKKFKNLFRQLTEAGHEIALHPSKFAFDKIRAYRDEKNKLEAVSGVKIQGMRQHYLRGKFPRLWVLAEKAGLNYDASLGYNFQAGFRAGTTFPFQTYDYSEDKLLSLTEFSLHVFEYNFLLSGLEEDASATAIKKVISQVARHGGLFVTLLHPSNYRREPFKLLWEILISELTRYRIYVASLSEHLQWRRQRDRIKLSLAQAGSHQQALTINLPEAVSQLTIEVIGSRVLSVPMHVILEDIGAGCYNLKTKKQKFTIALTKNA